MYGVDGSCDVPDCNRYSDIDVYFFDGTDASMCAEHAWLAENVEQGIPQHGSDEVNIEMTEGEMRQWVTL